ncbi:MAG: sigma-70 family RNA polymerase sigma factor [Bacteroidetes bacterium]|jgi:DNA-directed RNA polymerase specialized sigma24 family protein|nr:sigma-70 family RNA polymerase sigma factor [Bacteroidota bacterium]
MDYSGLVTSIRDGDDLTAAKLCAEATPILKKYLLKKFGASPADADDAIQKMYEYIIVKIREDDIENPKGLLAYMLKTCKHNYLKVLRERNPNYLENMVHDPSEEEHQLWELVNEDEQRILKHCLGQLRKGYREFISFWFTYPNASTEDVAEYFDITINNAWIRKHRVINKLYECVEEKI